MNVLTFYKVAIGAKALCNAGAQLHRHNPLLLLAKTHRTSCRVLLTTARPHCRPQEA